MKYHSIDYKLQAVKHYINKTKNYTKTCKEFNCSRISLYRWTKQYNKNKTITRKNKKPISYKITKEQVNYALSLLKNNQQITMKSLIDLIKQKYPKFDITPQHLGSIIRDNNKTRKRTRQEHFPKYRNKTLTDKLKELKSFYSTINKYPIDKIISLDETSIKPTIIPEYSRCNLGDRCIFKTDDNYVFKPYTLLVAINNNKTIGYILYDKGGSTKERIVEFIDNYITEKYKNYLIVLDNARSHNNQMVKDKIIESGNNYLFSVPYTPKTNAIEMFFSQIKGYLKLNKKLLKFNELKKEIDKVISKVSKSNYNNYFNCAYIRKLKPKTRKLSTLHRKAKIYKNEIKK